MCSLISSIEECLIHSFNHKQIRYLFLIFLTCKILFVCFLGVDDCYRIRWFASHSTAKSAFPNDWEKEKLGIWFTAIFSFGEQSSQLLRGFIDSAHSVSLELAEHKARRADQTDFQSINHAKDIQKLWDEWIKLDLQEIIRSPFRVICTSSRRVRSIRRDDCVRSTCPHLGLFRHQFCLTWIEFEISWEWLKRYKCVYV